MLLKFDHLPYHRQDHERLNVVFEGFDSPKLLRTYKPIQFIQSLLKNIYIYIIYYIYIYLYILMNNK